MKKIQTLSILLLFVGIRGATADTIHVPQDHATIQSALDSAGVNDTIIVAPGVYEEALLITENGIKLLSSDPENPNITATTVLRGAAGSPSVISVDIENNCAYGGTSRIAGFTIENSESWGISLGPESCNLTIDHNIIRNNGIAGIDSFQVGAPIRISDNFITNNGFGIVSSSSSIWVERNVLTNNHSALGGRVDEIAYNVIAHNDQAGISLTSGYADVHHNRISDNQNGVIYGGGNATVSNNMIHGNRYGILPGIEWRIINNTIVGNQEAGVAFVGVFGGTPPVISNCIVWGNGIDILEYSGSGIVEYSCLGSVFSGEGNLVAYPQFVDYAAGDFHLNGSSPCINRGTPTYDWTLSTTDIDGDPRVLGGRIDIGADEVVNLDCNDNGVPDAIDVSSGTSQDCDFSGVPDECEGDSDSDGFIDACDNCPQYPNPDQYDCDGDGVGDICTLQACEGEPDCSDCNHNQVPDGCDIATGYSDDWGSNGIPDECEERPCLLKGDVDFDGELTLGDLYTLLDVFERTESNPPSELLCVADMDDNGRLELKDVRLLMEQVLDKVCRDTVEPTGISKPNKSISGGHPLR